MKRLFVIGGAATDIIGYPFKPLIPEDSNPGQIQIGFGGVGRNIAVNAVNLKTPVIFHSCFAQDILGKLNHENCCELGIDMRHAQWIKEARSAKYMAILDDQGDMYNAIADVSILDQVDISHYQSVLDDIKADDVCVLDANLNQDILIELVKRIPGRLAFEPISSTKALKAKALYPKIKILKPNRLEAEALLGCSIVTDEDMMRALKAFMRLGVEEIIISDGENGVYLGFEHHYYHLKHPPVISVNATGAGDAFFAAYLSFRLQGKSILEACESAMIAARLTILHEQTVDLNLSLERISTLKDELTLSIEDLSDEN